MSSNVFIMENHKRNLVLLNILAYRLRFGFSQRQHWTTGYNRGKPCETPTIVKPAGIKVTPMPGRQGQRSECFVGVHVQVLVYRSGVFEYMYLVSRALDN